MQLRRFPKDYMMIRQGDTGSLAWLIEEGQIEVFRTESDGSAVPLALLGKGAIVGEMALVDDGLRVASARACTDVTCLEIDRTIIQKMIGSCQPLVCYMLESMDAAIRRGHGLPQEERIIGGSEIRSVRDFEKFINRRTFDANFTFFKQGEPSAVADLIQNGEVTIERHGSADPVTLAVLGPGRIFGELGMLNNDVRKASAISKTVVTCEIIKKKEFLGIISTLPPILRAMTRIFAKHLNRLCAH